MTEVSAFCPGFKPDFNVASRSAQSLRPVPRMSLSSISPQAPGRRDRPDLFRAGSAPAPSPSAGVPDVAFPDPALLKADSGELQYTCPDCSICAARPKHLRGPRAFNGVRFGQERQAHVMTIKAGKDLFRQGETCDVIYSLIDGWVIHYNILEDGSRQILHFATPGDFLGYNPMPDMASGHSAQALTSVKVQTIPRAQLDGLVKDCTAVGTRMAQQLALERALAYDHLASIGRRSARERVAHLILELFVRYRARWPGHNSEVMTLPLTQQDIGDAVGLSGVHVNRILSKFKSEGILAFHYRKLHILNPDRLVDIAGFDPRIPLLWAPKPPEAHAY